MNYTGGGGHRLPFHYKENNMSKIPSDITTAEAARHWLRVNGHSVEKTEALVAEWINSGPDLAAAPAPVEEEAAASAPVEEEAADEEEQSSTSIWKSKKK